MGPDPSARRVAVVTGGAGGIGAKICEALASAGFRVVVGRGDSESSLRGSARFRRSRPVPAACGSARAGPFGIVFAGRWIAYAIGD